MKPCHPIFLLCPLALFLAAALSLAQDQAQPPARGNGEGRDLLSLDLESLSNLQVTTASKFAERLSDAPGVISVVTKDELRRFGGITLREILERVPGLAGASAYFTDRSLVAIRGDQSKINGGHILFLINGRPIREVLEGGIISDLLESFPVSALERIEVIKGPGSVLYGSNAFSGVINLITQKPDRSRFTLSTAAGADGTLMTTGTGMLMDGDLSIIGSAQFRRQPDWTTTYRFPFFDPLTSAPPVQIVTLPDRGEGAYLGMDYKGLSLMSSFTDWRSSSFVRGVVGDVRWRRYFADLGYRFRASNRWDMSLNVTYSRNTLATWAFPSVGRDSNEVVVEWTNFLKLGGKDRLTFGTLYNHVQGAETYYGVSPAIAISQGGRTGVAAYAQLDHQLLPNLKLVGGAQVNKIGSLGIDVVPRAGVIWSLGSRVNLKALYGQAFRAPSINETRLNHPGLEGNPNLRPEQVGTFDLELSYQGNRVQAGVNYFHSKHTDSIVSVSGPLRWKYVNLGEATFQGVGVEGKYYLSSTVFLMGSTSYQANQDGDGNKNVTPVPNLLGKAGVSYQAERGFTASLFDVYQGPLEGYGQTLNPQPRPVHLLSSHVRLDISRYVGADPKAGVALFVHADNLANRQVWLPDWGGNSGDTIPVRRGRTIWFGIEFSLTKE